MKKKIKKLAMRLTAVILCFSALFGSITFTVSAAYYTATAEKKDNITITSDTNEIRRGDTLQLKSDTKNVTWSSSNTKIATVDENGLVKGI